MKKGMVKSLIAVASVLTASCAAFAADCDVLVVGGGAAGIAAALAVRRQCDVRSVPIAELRARLTASGAIVPAVAAERKGR